MNQDAKSKYEWKILLVGNNPIELSQINDQLHAIREPVIMTEMAFDSLSAFQRLITFRAQHIILDDNIGKPTIKSVMARLQRRGSLRVAVTVLKNSNYEETIGYGAINYVLKQSLSSELLHDELMNSIHFQKRHALWERSFRKRQSNMARLISMATIQI